MKKVLSTLIITFGFCFSLLAGTGVKEPVPVTQIEAGQVGEKAKDKLLAKILQHRLENVHYSKKKINDERSRDAFGLYLKRLDFGKRFLLKSDVDKLKAFNEKIDDEIINGDFELNQIASNLLKTRIRDVQKIVDEVMKKKFDFAKDEWVEVDPDKREFAKDLDEQKDRWRKLLKHEVLTKFISEYDHQEHPERYKNDKEKDKTKKDDKKKSKKELLAEAQEETAKTYKRILKRMLKDDRQDELERFINAMAMSYDPHTVYLPPREKENFNIDIEGSLEGIGAVLREDGDYIKVVEIVPGSPSWKQGQLKADDIILKVAQGKKEPVDIVGLRVGEAVQYIRGKKGTEVRLTVKKSDGQLVVVPIVRDVVIIEESYVKSALIEDEVSKERVGYILVPKFYREFSKGFDSDARNVTSDIKKELDAFNKIGVDGVIVDLRNDGGGSLEDARQTAGLFIKEGPVVQIKYSNQKIEVMEDDDSSVSYNGPLVVLVNRYSASASEIVAGALQDYGRAIIVGGDKTHGKGTVQTVLELDRGIMKFYGLEGALGSLKLTISKFYRVSGGSTQYKGIVPDVSLPDPYSFADTGESSLDFSLPWDEVQAVPHEMWHAPWDLKELAKRSQERSKKNSKFQKISKSIELLKERKEQTKISLKLDKFKQHEEDYRAKIEDLKYDDEELKTLKISFRPEENVKNTTDKKLKEEQQKRKDEFAKSLRVDPFIEESVNIIRDVIQMTKQDNAKPKKVKKGFWSNIFG